MPVEVMRQIDFEEVDDDQSNGFSQRRHAHLQRSQDSGALTDWSGTSRSSPTRQSCHSADSVDEHKYVTVLSVNGGLDLQPPPAHNGANDADFVTVLSVGPAPEESDHQEMPSNVGSVCLSLAGFVEEVACIARRPGQKLGFGLKFDGGNDSGQPVNRLYIQCCAQGSPASQVRCSWGRLVEADEIVEIDGIVIRDTLNRLQVVSKLKDGQDSTMSLKIRHYWDDNKRHAIMEQLNCVSPKAVESVTRKAAVALQQERAVDVPDELLIQSVRGQHKKGVVTKVVEEEEATPPVPPRRKRRPKVSSASKQAVCRSLSSDEVLINGHRVAATNGAPSTPSKPPRNRSQQHSRSFNENHVTRSKEEWTQSQSIERNQRNDAPPSAMINGREPQQAEIYIDLIAEEDKRLSMENATESEGESSSSVSTVVDNWSVTSSSSADPFGDFSEHEEYRIEQPVRQIVIVPTTTTTTTTTVAVADQTPVKDILIGQVETTSDSTLSVLIEPPETFLDDGPTSISPSGHLDASSDSGASCDSGASSGGSQLHLAESDEELRVFQQVENALELGHDCDAISAPTGEPDVVAGLLTTANAIYTPNIQLTIADNTRADLDDDHQANDNNNKRNEGGVAKESAKVEHNHPPNVTDKKSRSTLNRTPLRSRIPTPSSTTNRTTTTTTTPIVKNASSTPSVRRPVINSGIHKSGGGLSSTAKVVKSPANTQQTLQQRNTTAIAAGHRLAAKATTPSSQQRGGGSASGDNTNKAGTATTPAAASSNLPKSVKPGLSSKIPRPSGQKSSSTTPSARPTTTVRHSSLLPRTAAGVRASTTTWQPLQKSTSRLHLTHNKGESLVNQV